MTVPVSSFNVPSKANSTSSKDLEIMASFCTTRQMKPALVLSTDTA